MRPKKICFIGPKSYHLFNPKIEAHFGGAQIQLTLLAKELAKEKNMEVHYIVADHGQEEKEYHENVWVWKSLNYEDPLWKQLLVTLRVIRKINADVYIQRALNTFSGIVAVYCKLIKKNFVYMLANDGESDGTHLQHQGLIKKITAKILFHLSDRIIVQNDYQQKNLREKFGKEGIKILSSITLDNTPQTQGIKKDSILWVSRLDKIHKRPELFIEIAKHFPHEKFVLIGPPATGQKKYHMEVKKSANAVPNLEFIDFVPFEKIDDYFQKAKIFINTSNNEGFPNTFLQAAKNKIPVISLNVSPNNCLDEFEFGHVCGNDMKRMIESIKKILYDQELAKKMSSNAYHYVTEYHDIKNNAKKFKTLLLNM